mgnify:FL=1
MSDDTQTILEGTNAHFLLVEALVAFYEWQDSGWKLEPDIDFYEKTYNLVGKINEFKKAREEYKNRKSKYHLTEE